MIKCPKCSKQIKGKVKFCPSCGAKIGRQTSSEKKARLTEQKKGNKVPLLAIGALVVCVGAAGALYALFRPEASSVTAGPAGSSGPAGVVSFPTNTFEDGTAKHYSYKAPSGKKLNFFVLKSSDGVIRAAFDSCDVCFAQKKGYRQEGNFMVCNNCGQRFISTKINVIRGGCNPAPLERNIQGQNLVIAVNDILSGARYF